MTGGVSLPQNVTTTESPAAFLNYTVAPPHIRQGVVYDQWPFRLDIATEYQDWILVAMTFILFCLWFLPCICGRMRNPRSRKFTEWIYTRLNKFFWFITYFNLAVVMFTIGVLPNWTVNQYLEHLLQFITWVLLHMEKCIESAGVIVGFFIFWKLQGRIRAVAGLDHISFVHFSMREAFGFHVKRRPIEVFIWKVEDLPSSAKMYKANDIFIECHFGDNEPMRTRVHNNAGGGCVMKQSFQINIKESEPAALMTLVVKDQSFVVSGELARLVLSTREVIGIEDQTGKRKLNFQYSDECFVELALAPRGRIWIAVAPVDDYDEEQHPLLKV